MFSGYAKAQDIVAGGQQVADIQATGEKDERAPPVKVPRSHLPRRSCVLRLK
jgi:hypothetical protein